MWGQWLWIENNINSFRTAAWWDVGNIGVTTVLIMSTTLPVRKNKVLQTIRFCALRSIWPTLPIMAFSVFSFTGDAENAASSFNTWSAVLPEPSILPSSRAFHSMISYGSDGVLVYGGQNVEMTSILPSLYSLNMTTMSWTEQKPDGSVTRKGVFGHTAVNVYVPQRNNHAKDVHYMVCFGGVMEDVISFNSQGGKTRALVPSNETWVYGPINGTLADARWYKPLQLNWPTAGKFQLFCIIRL